MKVLEAVTVAVASVALWGGGAARAATLKELMDAADQRNVDQEISREMRVKAAQELTAASLSLAPSITAQAGYTRNEYEAKIPASPLTGGQEIVITPYDQLDGLVRVELPLVDTTRWFRAAAASAAVDAAENRVEMTRDAIRRQVATTYYAYAAALAVRESAKRSLSVAEAQLKLQEVRHQTGVVTELEVLRARAEVELANQRISDANMQVANARRALLTLTGLDPGDVADLPADDLRPEGTLEDLEQRALDLPAVKAAEADAKAAERLSTAARLALVPMISANFSERASNYSGFSGKDHQYTAGVGLVWRLDGATWFNADAAATQSSIAQLTIERAKLQVRDQVHNDYQRLTAAIQKVSAARAQVEAARRAAQLSRERYELGAATQLDVITTERDFFAAEVNEITARAELASSHITLRLSAGLPLGL
ncbi:MAG: TolC family protein [Myxococcaceae bacterium]|nr:TolC family protein [Myxococcaceae bacterium]